MSSAPCKLCARSPMEFSGKDCFDSPFCVIIVLVLRIAFIGRRRPFMGGFFCPPFCPPFSKNYENK
nr:MAG TPA: hypothetical protein [Caudoviricetes sp.]